MPPVDHQHLPYLDGWRGLAICGLLMGHFFPVAGINVGAVGVALFFVLSGLLMTRILFVQKVPLVRFYQRRISRIFPSVYVYLTFLSLVYLLSGRTLSPLELLSAATFTNNYITPAGPWTMPFGHIWSLSVEEHAYVALSLLAVLTRHSARRSLAALVLACAAMAFLAGIYGLVFSGARLAAVWSHSEVAAFGIFISGFLLLWTGQRRTARLHPLVAPCLLAAGVAAHWWSVPGELRLVVGGGAFALALHVLHSSPGLLRRLLEWAPLRRLGVWSFSLYLWQQPFYMLVHREGMHPALGLALSLAVGMLAFHLIENPARLWLNRKWSETKAAPAAAAEDEEQLLPR